MFLYMIRMGGRKNYKNQISFLCILFVVLKDNERIVANEYSNLSRSNFSSTNFTFSSKSGITYSFLGESFNNMKQKNIF